MLANSILFMLASSTLFKPVNRPYPCMCVFFVDIDLFHLFPWWKKNAYKQYNFHSFTLLNVGTLKLSSRSTVLTSCARGLYSFHSWNVLQYTLLTILSLGLCLYFILRVRVMFRDSEGLGFSQNLVIKWRHVNFIYRRLCIDGETGAWLSSAKNIVPLVNIERLQG